jgi:hypothetical protein
VAGRLSELLLLAVAASSSPSPGAGERLRLEIGRAVVVYDTDDLSSSEAGAFAALAARGVADIERLVAPGLPEWAHVPGRVRFVISARVPISRTRGRTVYLPLARVRRHEAPYLHETVHAIVPSREGPTWLCEGLACYLESYVSETRGGYDAHVFTRAGDRGIHAAARRTLGGEPGRAVLPWVGGCGDPPRMEQDRAGVARPFYVLSHSLTKYLVDSLGLEAVVRALTSGRENELFAGTRRSDDAWRRAWLSAILQGPFPGPSIDPRIPVNMRSCG